MTRRPNRVPSDFDASPAMRRAAFDAARRDHAMGRRVDPERIAAMLKAQGYQTSARSIDRHLRRECPELFGRGPCEHG